MRAAEVSQAGNVCVADAGNFQSRRQCVAVELRVVAGARHGAHVHQARHRVGLEQINEFFQAARGVAYGQYHVTHVMHKLKSAANWTTRAGAFPSGQIGMR